MAKKKELFSRDVDKKTFLVKGERVYMDPNDLIPYKYNARKHQTEIEDLVNIMKVVGFPDAKAIEVDKNMVIINGHGRRLAALKLGMKKVPVLIRDMPDELARAYRIADNKISDKSGWDYDILEMEYKDLKSLDIPMEDFGFEDMGFDELFDEGDNKSPTVFIDETDTSSPAATTTDDTCDPVTYKLGKHTVSFKSIDETIQSLVDNERTYNIICSDYADFMRIVKGWEDATGKKHKEL